MQTDNFVVDTMQLESLESREAPVGEGDVVLSVNQVSKRFCRNLKRSLFYGVQDIGTEVLGLSRDVEHLRPQEFWALKDVSLELRRGEAVGLVGANGAGKTTLLRIISGLIKPDTGSVEIRGRVAPLIALGAGFNPILTGRENIYVNMAILGLSQQEIEERFERVIEFAEIGEAIDSPVQSYSSGMAARLGFASAIFTEPDILLVDEVLAVGDLSFRAKCTRKIADLRTKGVSIILVSHSSGLVLGVCEQAVYLNSGKVKMTGRAGDVVSYYEGDLFGSGVSIQPGMMMVPSGSHQADSPLKMTYIALKDRENNIIDYPVTGQEVILAIGCDANQAFNNCIVPSICFEDLAGGGVSDDPTILAFAPHHEGLFLSLPSGKSEIQVILNPLVLRSGKYGIRIWLNKLPLPNGLSVCHDFKFEVKSPAFDIPRESNLFFQPITWVIQY